MSTGTEQPAETKNMDNGQPSHPQAEPPQQQALDPKVATPQHGGEIRAEQMNKPHDGVEATPARDQHGHDGHGEDAIPEDLKQPGAGTILMVGVVAVLLMVALFLIGWIPDRHRVSEANADARERADAKPIVSTTRPSAPNAERDILLPCDVKANQDTALYSRATGFLKKWHVDINDRVTAGEVLADIDIPDVEAQLAQSRATLEQNKAAVVTAQSNLDLATVTLNRYLEANKNQPGSVTQEDIDTHQAQHDQADAALKQAQANVSASQANVRLEETLQGFEKIYAPFDGVVTYRGYDNGALINSTDQSAGKELFDIQQTDPLRVFVSVPQDYATQIVIGQTADLLVRNYPNEPFTGKVVRSSASIDPTTRTEQFQIDFSNPDNKLYPGMYGQIKLPVQTHSTTLTIPASALVFNSSGSQVVVIKDGKAHFQPISVGRDFGTSLEVTTGLAAGDEVDLNPDERITENGEVEVKNGKDEPVKPQPAERIAAKD